jgi:hypothetical protein
VTRASCIRYAFFFRVAAARRGGLCFRFGFASSGAWQRPPTGDEGDRHSVLGNGLLDVSHTFAEPRIRRQVLAHLVVELRDHDVRHRLAGRLRAGDAVADRRLDLGHLAPEQDVPLAAEVVRQSQVQDGHAGALDACVGRIDGRCHRLRLDHAERLAAVLSPRASDRRHDVRVHVGEVDDVHERGTGDLAPRLERLLDVRGLAADQHQVLAGVNRAGPDDVERRALDHRVPGLDPPGDRRELEHGDGGLHQTIRRAPTTVIRRSRENVRGLVSPSPVGLAMENEEKPSPPCPSPE